MRITGNVIGFDDSAYDRQGRGRIPLVGVICARTRMNGMVLGKVSRDGCDSTKEVIRLVQGRFDRTIGAVLLQGIAFAGFNVVDIHHIAEQLARPVLVVARHQPNLSRIQAALEQVRGGAKKWALIEKAGPMEPCRTVWVQRAGLNLSEAEGILKLCTLEGHQPEALRLAHLIGGGVGRGFSGGRA